MKYIKGDLIRGAKQFDVIVHQCNCFCKMGAGIAPQIKSAFPEAYKIDCETARGDKSKLGKITYTKNTEPIVVNAYAQYGTGRGLEGATNYHALRYCLKEIKKLFSGKKIGMPLIGAGLGGGDWAVISGLIKEELDNEDVTIVIWERDYQNLEKFNLS